MSREWKPGDVAVAAFPVWGSDQNDGRLSYVLTRLARFDGGWTRLDNPDDNVHDGSRYEPADPRPLVVIDPEDRAAVERLRDLWDDAHLDQQGHRPSPTHKGARGNALQAALRSLIADPKPEEPTGLGAVVEDERGRYYTRYDLRDPQPWWWNSRNPDDPVVRRFAYADLAAVKVLSEGVTL